MADEERRRGPVLIDLDGSTEAPGPGEAPPVPDPAPIG